MLSISNKTGISLVWPEGSDLVEVYRKDVIFNDQPFEVVAAPDKRSKDSLQAIFKFYK